MGKEERHTSITIDQLLRMLHQSPQQLQELRIGVE